MKDKNHTTTSFLDARCTTVTLCQYYANKIQITLKIEATNKVAASYMSREFQLEITNIDQVVNIII